MDASYPFRQAILSRLHSGQWQPGERLPTERDFCDQFGISRTTVRKVLSELKEQGLIHQTVGSGTYASERSTPLKLLQSAQQVSQHTSPAEFMQARLALEPAIIDLVVGNATAADFDAMQECCNKAEAARTYQDFEMWDGQFHETIAMAAHNNIVTSVFKMMNEARAHSEWGLLKKRSLTTERRLTYQHEHRALLEALRDRDPARARQVVVEHLLGIRRNLLNY